MHPNHTLSAATVPDQLWVAGLTDVRTHAGWTYLAFVLDLSLIHI